MNLVGIEEITPYKDSFEFKLFKYDKSSSENLILFI